MNQSLLDKILKCPRLPSLPTIAIEVIDLCRQPDINIKQIADMISNDPALSTKILRTVNSSYYGLSRSISTISHALVILGLNTVKTLALGFSLVSNFRDAFGGKYDPVLFWRRSLYAAVGARTIAHHVGVLEHEEAFLGGLLQDLGIMAMIQTIGQEYADLLADIGDNHAGLSAAERTKFDLDHPVVGATLAAQWQLPPVLVEPIRHHDDPQSASEPLRALVRCVHLGGLAADTLIRENPAEDCRRLHERAADWFRLDAGVITELLEKVSEATRQMAKLFDIDAGPVRDVGEILALANETLLQISMQSHMNANALKEENRQLLIQATTDPLTGAANRGRFNEFMRDKFEEASRRRSPLSVIFMDADRFKSFNDTHGHAAGDQVLVTVAQVLKENTPESGLVARYGGEEFSVVLPGLSRREAAQLAEKIRQAMEARVIDFESKTLNVTLSLGVATHEGTDVFKSPEQLLKAADNAVYAAKASGRNCVRVFAPKVNPAPAAKATA